MITDARPMQRSLQRLGLYLGKIDGAPGGLTCDALVRFLAGPHAPNAIGRPLADAIPPEWWAMPRRVNMMLAQVNAECGFRPIAENLTYTHAEALCDAWPTRFGPGRGSDPNAFLHNPIALGALVYGGRMGNYTPEDGFRFRGRGWPQLTGRWAYVAYSDAAGVDLESNPDALMRLDVSARVTIAFMQRTRGMLAAADAGNVPEARHLWNGGANGLQCASDSFDKLQILWGFQ